SQPQVAEVPVGTQELQVPHAAFRLKISDCGLRIFSIADGRLRISDCFLWNSRIHHCTGSFKSVVRNRYNVQLPLRNLFCNLNSAIERGESMTCLLAAVVVCPLLVLGLGSIGGLETLPGEKHLANIRQLTSGGENAEAYFSFDQTKLIFQSTRPPYGCDQIFTM